MCLAIRKSPFLLKLNPLFTLGEAMSCETTAGQGCQNTKFVKNIELPVI